MELSERKRVEVFTEAKLVLESIGVDAITLFSLSNAFPQAGIKGISDFPSRLSLERFLVTFFECFLDYHPFLHVPTWQTEDAHPCLLLAMLVIGAGCYKEYSTAHALYCAARHFVTMHVGLRCTLTLALLLTEPRWEMPLPQHLKRLFGPCNRCSS